MNATDDMDWEDLRVRLARRLAGGWSLEPASVLKAVAAHREYWRPKEVRVLLLAESHVLTHEHELAAKVDLARHGHAGAPGEFVRLVYCLGYGERDLVPGVIPNQGTPQFWKLFAACVGDMAGASLLKGSEKNLERRVEAKIRLLEELKARGVWLLDASPVALYRPGGGKPMLLEKTLVAAWEQYSQEVVRSVAPAAVIVIGKGVFNALGKRVKAAVPGATVDVIAQPQARATAAEHRASLEKLRETVTQFGRTR